MRAPAPTPPPAPAGRFRRRLRLARRTSAHPARALRRAAGTTHDVSATGERGSAAARKDREEGEGNEERRQHAPPGRVRRADFDGADQQGCVARLQLDHRPARAAPRHPRARPPPSSRAHSSEAPSTPTPSDAGSWDVASTRIGTWCRARARAAGPKRGRPGARRVPATDEHAPRDRVRPNADRHARGREHERERRHPGRDRGGSAQEPRRGHAADCTRAAPFDTPARRRVRWPFDGPADAPPLVARRGRPASPRSRAAAGPPRRSRRRRGRRSCSSRSTRRAPTRSGPRRAGVETPAFNALAARGRALPPGVRDRAGDAAVAQLDDDRASIRPGTACTRTRASLPAAHAARSRSGCSEAGYRTAAFVSSFVLARRFGLARGFDVYDDDAAGGRRRARAARDDRRARSRDLAARRRRSRVFLWVHYFDPHAPYAPPEPFRSALRGSAVPRRGRGDGRAARPPRRRRSSSRRAGPGRDRRRRATTARGSAITARRSTATCSISRRCTCRWCSPARASRRASSDTPVSTRRVFHTHPRLGRPRRGATACAAPRAEVVLGEAMKPFLEYGWQPQVMAVEGTHKAILAGTARGLRRRRRSGRDARPRRGARTCRAPLRNALDDYPVPSPDARAAPDALDDEARRRLASLGYVSAGAAPVVRKDAPRPADMTALFDVLEQASALFVRERVRARRSRCSSRSWRAIPTTSTPRCGWRRRTRRSGTTRRRVAAFERAAAIAPRVAGRPHLPRAALRARPGLGARGAAARAGRRGVARSPARARGAGRRPRARRAGCRRRSRCGSGSTRCARRPPAELVQLGQLAMAAQQTALRHRRVRARARRAGPRRSRTISSWACSTSPRAASRRRATALDRVPASHPDYPMALFKRAQVSVLLQRARPRRRGSTRARRRADATTRPLIERERLFARRLDEPKSPAAAGAVARRDVTAAASELEPRGAPATRRGSK